MPRAGRGWRCPNGSQPGARPPSNAAPPEGPGDRAPHNGAGGCRLAAVVAVTVVWERPHASNGLYLPARLRQLPGAGGALPLSL